MVHPEFESLGDDKKVDMGSNRGKPTTLEKAESPCPQVSFTMRWGCLTMSMWDKNFMLDVLFFMSVPNGVLFDAPYASRGMLSVKGAA